MGEQNVIQLFWIAPSTGERSTQATEWRRDHTCHFYQSEGGYNKYKAQTEVTIYVEWQKIVFICDKPRAQLFQLENKFLKAKIYRKWKIFYQKPIQIFVRVIGIILHNYCIIFRARKYCFTCKLVKYAE